MKGSSRQRLGEANKRLVLNEVRRSGSNPVSVETLVRRSGKSQPTVLKWLGFLEEEGWLVRDGRGASTGGRPPTLYRFASERAVFVGLGVEIPSAHLVLVDASGVPLASEGWSIDRSMTSDALLENLCSRTERFATAHASPGAELSGVGLAFSGFIDRESGTSLATPRLEDWRHVAVRRVFSERLGVSTLLHHHIDTLAQSELCYGAANGWSDFLYFDVGYGLGVRAFRDGLPVQGVFGNAGLIGHTTVVPDGRPCICGNRGCLEEYVSGRALLRDVAPLLPDDDLEDHNAWSRAMLRLRDHPDAEIAKRIEQMLEYLALGIANAVNVFDTPTVLLSGFFGRGEAEARSDLLERVRSRLQPTLAGAADIRFATVERPLAGAAGAALFALRERFPFADPLVVQNRVENHAPEEVMTRKRRSA